MKFRALILCLALAAPAQAQNVTTMPIPPAPKASGGANLGSAQLYAAGRFNGVLDEQRSKGTMPCPGGTCKVGTGLYRIEFARDVSHCAIIAMASFTPLDGAFVNGTTATASHDITDPKKVVVWTFGPNDASADAGFFLQVLC